MAFSASWSNSTEAQPIVITISPTAGDVLLAWAVCDVTAQQTFAFPAGFEQIGYRWTSAVDGQTIAVAIKRRATGAETTVSISTSATACIGGVIALSGRNNSGIGSVFAFNPNERYTDAAGNSPWSQVSDSITPFGDGVDLVAILGSDQTTAGDAVQSFATSSGSTGAWTVREDQNNAGGFTNVGVGTATQTTSGPITITGTGTNAAKAAARALFVIGLLPDFAPYRNEKMEFACHPHPALRPR